MVVYNDTSEITSKSIKLNPQCTVFQAEIQGVQMAVNWIIDNLKPNCKYAINVDSQATLRAISSNESTNPVIVKIRKDLQVVLTTNEVTFQGHTWHYGNEPGKN